MLLTQQTLRDVFELSSGGAPKIIIAFAGMSGAGKTYQSQVLAKAYNFRDVEFDDLIGTSEELIEVVKDYPGKDTAEKLGRYLDLPGSEGRLEREAVYLRLEAAFMDREWPPGTILNLTGSSYVAEEQMKKIKKYALIVCLDIDGEGIERNHAQYMEDPASKGVCFHGIFNQDPGEVYMQALKRSHKALQQHRIPKYKEHADVVLPYEIHRGAKSADELMAEIIKRLPEEKHDTTIDWLPPGFDRIGYLD